MEIKTAFLTFLVLTAVGLFAIAGALRIGPSVVRLLRGVYLRLRLSVFSALLALAVVCGVSADVSSDGTNDVTQTGGVQMKNVKCKMENGGKMENVGRGGVVSSILHSPFSILHSENWVADRLNFVLTGLTGFSDIFYAVA